MFSSCNVKAILIFSVTFLCAYFGSFSCINEYIFKELLGHKNPVPIHHPGTFCVCECLISCSIIRSGCSFLSGFHERDILRNEDSHLTASAF
jgi:hypothetical protein